MIIGITGHRANKLPDMEWLKESLKDHFELFGATHIVQGCANGTDLIAARVAFEMKIPYTAVKPWQHFYGGKNKNSGFEKNDDKVYKAMIKKAKRVVNASGEDVYGKHLYQVRNEWIVDNSQMLIAVWDGTASGTYNCLKYAVNTGKRIYRINPETQTGEYIV